MTLSKINRMCGYGLKPLALLATLTVLGCGGESGQAQSSDPPDPNPTAAQDVDPQEEIFDLSELGIDEGSRMTSAIGVVDFSDFGCIYCANFHVEDYPALYEEFVLSGDILWKYVPISIGGFPNGDLAGVTGICADEVGRVNGFTAMRDQLFENREEWLGATPSDAPGIFLSYAEVVGLDPAAFSACLQGGTAASRLVRNNEMARQVGVTATPTFIVQGSPVRGAPALADFQQALRGLVGQMRTGAGAPQATGTPGGV